MSTYFKKMNLALVLIFIISLYSPGNVKAASENSGLYRAAFSKKSPANHSEELDPLNVKLEWNSVSNVFQYLYCYYSSDLTENVCDINDKATWISNDASTSVQLPILSPNRKYYWQVAAKLENNSVVFADGSLTSNWVFTTAEIDYLKNIYDDTDSKWTYSGAWMAGIPTEAFNKTIHKTSKIGDYAQLSFTGSMFVLIYTKAPNRGLIRVYVDGNKVGTIDAFSATTLWQQAYRSPIYPQGNHTVRFTRAGPDGTFMDIDAIKVFDAPLKAGIYDDANSGWFYSGTWTAGIPAEAYYHTVYKTSTPGDYAELAFYGTRFILTYTKAFNRGLVNVYVDGGLVDTINAQNATTIWQATWMSPLLTIGNHIVRFEHAGAAGNVMDIDAIKIVGTLVRAGYYDDTNSNWFYSGTWTAGTATEAANDTIHRTSKVGAFAELTFYGTRFILTYTKGSNRGLIDVYVDGGLVDTINAFKATTTWQATWMSPLLTIGKHTVTFQQADAAGILMDIDAIKIVGTLVPAGTYDDTNSNWFYSGTWTTSTPAQAYNATIHKTDKATAFAELSFTGSRFVLTYTKASTRGSIGVYVDGILSGTINANDATTAWQTTWKSPLLTPGKHTVTLQHADPDGIFIDIDAIKIMSS